MRVNLVMASAGCILAPNREGGGRSVSEGIYEGYARVYDRSGQRAFSVRMVPYVERLLGGRGVEATSLADVACGTGTFALAMAAKGWDVVGVDASGAMLAQARAKAENQGADVRWLQQDMRELRLGREVSVITCLYDSLNYMLTSGDLVAAFRAAYRNLWPDGWYLFDMNTAYAFATMWDGDTYVHDGPDLTVLISGAYDEYRQRVRATVTWFERRGSLWAKGSEEHVEQAYPLEHVAMHLQDAGFVVEECYDCFTLQKPDDETTRILWMARRP